ncbi:putative xyloglucan endotransglucosylase/hydrolase protein 30 [Quercus suber]|uniref:Xyloglucan endotransglucosylase/hydrolase n=1 Tax=Quercus suber TaxID=58331 RepID=A0AAW0IHH2_QUESU
MSKPFCFFILVDWFWLWLLIGSGFISSNLYKHGFFSANIKLPSDYTAGICVAFYVRSTNRGREERYRLWFDPSKEFHRYSILWTANKTIFYIDEVPIREVVKNDAMGGDYPSKPMSLYTTIWDASNWATSGGRYKVNYKYAPFVAEFKDLVLEGCPTDPIEQVSAADVCAEKDAYLDSQDYAIMTRKRRQAMRWFRQRFMYYSYCYDTLRYPVPPPECVISRDEKQRFKDTGRLKFGGSHHKQSRQSKRRSRTPISSSASNSNM